MGGFGNVLFQLLASRVMIKKNIAVEYVNILTEKNIFTKVLNWTIHERLYNDLIPKGKIKNKIPMIKVFIIILIGLISKRLRYKNRISTFYNNFNIFEEPYSKNIFGYFQEKTFLKENQEEILKLGKEIKNIYSQEESKIIVHYREGDSHWAKENKTYYESVRELIKCEVEKVYIATDSPKEALEFFSECPNVELTNAKNAMDDFIHMVNAKKLYCAPSTFSWWAAHALPDTAQVIVPKLLKDLLGIYKKEFIVL